MGDLGVDIVHGWFTELEGGDSIFGTFFREPLRKKLQGD